MHIYIELSLLSLQLQQVATKSKLLLQYIRSKKSLNTTNNKHNKHLTKMQHSNNNSKSVKCICFHKMTNPRNKPAQLFKIVD